MFLRCFVFLFTAGLATLTPTPFAQTPAAIPAAADNLTEAQQAAFKELESDFTRLDTFLQAQPDSQPKFETQRVLGAMRKRAAELRKSFDQTRFDEIRFEVNFEHQQMLLWMLPRRVVPPESEEARARFNTITPQEKSSGWELLFDGKTLAGWRGYRLKAAPPAGWDVKDGMLHNAGGPETGVDLVTDRKFTNFELIWEWRVSPGANSGIKYFVTEDRPTAPGHEYQILDDEGDQWRDWRGAVHRTAAFYDVVSPAPDKPVKKAGEWNRSRLVVAGRRVEHWLNGRNVLTYELDSPAVKKGIARSKFKDERGFGGKVTGPILITYHATETWYRNLKIRELK